MGANTLHLKGGEALTAPIQTARFVCKAEHVRELTDTMSHITRQSPFHVVKVIELTENDLVICTNGCQGDASAYGDNTHAPVVKVKNGEGPSVEMWKKLAAQDPAFGRPEKFCGGPEKSNWESATVTTLDEKILPYIEAICKRDPLSGGVVTGGIVSVKDSSWLLSWTCLLYTSDAADD